MTKRFRITYEKTFELRYTAVLDMQKIWERYLRRSKVKIAYSQGFHPQPRMTQAAPLPLGFLSKGELIDVWLEDMPSDSEFFTILENCKQPGIIIKQVKEIDMREKSLPSKVIACEYQVEFLLSQQTIDELTTRVSELLKQKLIIRERRKKEYDLRKLILNLGAHSDNSQRPPMLTMTLSALPGATGRPEEVISALGLDPSSARITRLKTILSQP